MIRFKETAKVILLAAGLLLGHAAQAAGTANPAFPNANSYKTGATYGLGDSGPQGGKVYYIDASGAHGLEAKEADEINSLSWSDAVAAAGAYGSGWHLPTKTEVTRKKYLTLIFTQYCLKSIYPTSILLQIAT